jgi:hypothetical protein
MDRTQFALAASLLAAAGGLASHADTASGGPLPAFPEVSKYLVIGTGQGSSGSNFAAFQQSNTEIGADQELVSTSNNGATSQRTGSLPNGSTPNLFGTFLGTPGANAALGGNRWNDTDPSHSSDTVGVPDRLPGARPLIEGIDFSGNVALTGSFAKFESSNSDVNADLGIHCNRTPAGCFPNPSGSNTYFPGPLVSSPGQNLNTLNGVSQFNPAALISQLEDLRDFIVGLVSDTTLTAGYVNKNIKDDGAVQLTDLDALDLAGNNDGFAVIDIDVNNNKFELNNTDWILKSTKGTIAIFRMADGTYFDFANSSIMLGDGNSSSTDEIDELGAIFFQDAYKGNNKLFGLSNVILGGIGLWDFTDFNPNPTSLLNSATSVFNPVVGDATAIDMQNAQGCAQFISHQVLMSNNRWNACTASIRTSEQVPEPSTLASLAIGLLALGWMRRRA